VLVVNDGSGVVAASKAAAFAIKISDTLCTLIISF
jgi:hypothetical protein